MVSDLYRLITPRLLLVARIWLLQLIVKAVIGANWSSDEYLPGAAWVKFAANFLFYRFQILAIPSPIPAHRYSEFFEKAKVFTGAVPVTY
jgi:hypothetical protein